MENVTGVVIGGMKKSRLLGFPTANIEVSADLTSGPGIYAGYVVVEDLPTQAGEKYQSALYLAGESIIEAFILDFSGDLYDKEVQVQILEKIRDKRDFENDQDAKDQIAKDVAQIKELLNK